MKRCRSAKKYKGIYPPRCNNGDPCEICKETYAAYQAARRAAEEIMANKDNRYD